ncbi:hypothetical protein HUO14_11780 [Parasphingorhabdus flavimaris]|uniref:Uncharacterized protein n=1 Tax=Parasphingorhabdus flavimaris TaxID=266812 RepID=A0ABX2N4H7_9SPHN|nr:hypothetical protein [Parasphingorhabdus flavimaris]NVD28582.1 hypothetical protein [Parasphingorhabdus flavimaris]
MSDMRMILIEAAMVTSVLLAGMTVSQVAHATPLSASAQAAATDPRADVKIDSTIMVERSETSASGETVTKLLDPATVKVIPGDKLLFVNAYRNTGQNAVTGFVVNNPVHAAVALTEVVEDWALVSVDGGKNFGKLSELTVTETVATGTEETGETAAPVQTSRPAVASDVTHIRWVLTSPIAPGASGELRFRGIVK